MQKLYKILAKDGQSVHGGSLKWSLPTKEGDGWKPGEWHEVAPPVSVCSRGLHLITEAGLMRWYKLNTVIFEAEGAGAESKDTEKIAFERARLLKPAEVQMPVYWKKAIGFIEHEIPDIPWLKPDGRPNPEWKYFPAKTWDAARDAARAAVWSAWAAVWDAARDAALSAWAAGDAAWDAVWDAAGDAKLQSVIYICDGLQLDQKHIDHAGARMEVWRKGYGLLCDVDGVLYVYGVEKI